MVIKPETLDKARLLIQYMGIEEAARELGVQPRTLGSWIYRFKLKSWKAFKERLKEAATGPLALKALERPDNWDELDAREKWDWDQRLGILDWDGEIFS